MGLLNLISLMLFTTAAVQIAFLWRRVRDWRLAFLCLMFLVAALPGLIEFLFLGGYESLRWNTNAHDFQQFVIGLLAILAMWYIQRIMLSERRSTRAAVRSENELQTLIDNVPDIILRIDRNGKVSFINRPSLGYSIDEIVGRTLFDFLPAEVAETINATVEKAIEQSQMVEFDVPVVSKDGNTQYWYACRYFPTIQEGRVISSTVIATDITHRKRDEDELRRTQEELELRIFERTSELARANEVLHSEIAERKLTEAQLSRRIEFERIVSSISSLFVDLASDQIDEAINQSLRAVGEFAGGEHCSVCQVNDDSTLLSMTHEWHAENVLSGFAFFQNYPVKNFPWFWKKIQQQEMVKISTLEDIPAEGKAFRLRLESRNNLSFIAVPLSSGHSCRGYLAISSRTREVWWTEETVALMKIFGEISLSTLERTRVDQALQASEARFRQLLQSNIIGSFFSDIYGNIFEANDAFLQMLGYTRDDPPRRWDELTPPEWKSKDKQALEQLLARGTAAPREKEYFHKDGHRVPILIGVSLLGDNSIDCTTFVIDLTESKQASERIREMTVKLESTSRVSVMGEMTAGLAHELHQPLAVITNYANGCARRLERDSYNRDRLIDSLKEISDQAMRAGEILRRIRDFLHQREPQREYIDINHVIQDAIHLAELDSRRPNVRTVAQLGDNLPAVFVDSIQLTQTVLNLLLNGIEATADHCNGNNTVFIESSFNGDSHVQVSVTDSGAGISHDLASKVFDQFFTTKADGLGMGLAICKSTVEAHGGRLWVNPHSNGGAKFCFTVPIEVDRETMQERDVLQETHASVPSRLAES